MSRWLELLISALLLTQGASVPQAQEPVLRDLALVPNAPVSPNASVFRAPRGYALIIGVAKYEKLDSSQQLDFPETDAEAMHRALISHEGGAFPEENVHVLKGRQATLANIRHELEVWLPSVAQESDRVAVYFAGHGFVVNGRGYLAPWDIDPKSPAATGYSMATLGDLLANRVKAHWKVLYTDACHSGKINAETTNEGVEAALKSLPASFLNFTATSERESSHEDPALASGYGLFTYYIVQAYLGYADYDPCDGKTTAYELIEYVRSQVKGYARERGWFQTPNARGDYEPEMLLGFRTNANCLGSSGPVSMVGTAFVETTMDDVQVYVDGSLKGKVSRREPLKLPGLPGGLHDFEGHKEGYEPDRQQKMVAPGQEVTVTLRIRYVKEPKKAAVDLVREGERLLLAKRSTVNPFDIFAPSQPANDLRRARDLFTRALAEDKNYSRAAFFLGQANQLLADEKGALEAYRRALQIDPGYVDALRQYGAVLLERGDTDEAIRQFTSAIRLDPQNDEAHAFMAKAFWEKGAWSRAVETADEAIKLKFSNEGAHLWKADSLRQLAALEKHQERRKSLYQGARDSYQSFLDLTNYSTSAPQWIAFHFIGFGLGSRKHAQNQVSYQVLRSAGFLGMCQSEQKLDNPSKAKDYCRRALDYDSQDPIAHFILGNVYRDLFNRDVLNNTLRCDNLLSARDSYTNMLKLNHLIGEAALAASYLDDIQAKILKLNTLGARCG